jgi:hypothetical protein
MVMSDSNHSGKGLQGQQVEDEEQFTGVTPGTDFTGTSLAFNFFTATNTTTSDAHVHWPAASVQQANSYRRLAGQGHTFEQRNFLQLEAVRVAEANYDSETAVAFSNPYSSVGIDFVAGHFNGQSMPSNARVSVYLRAEGNEEEVVLLAEEQGAAWGEIELRRTDGKAIEQLRFALSTSKLDTASSTVYCFIYKMVMTA